MPMSEISQKYDEILSEYQGMIQNIQRNEDISANLAEEMQKELLRLSKISGQDDSLKELYEKIQLKDEIVKNSSQTVELVNVPRSERQSLKKTIKYASELLQEISAKFQEQSSIEVEINE